MAKPRPWTVLPHEPFEKLEENLWTVAGRLPHASMNRRMSVVRLDGGRLVLHNAVPLAEPAMRELEAFGAPAVLVVPNGFHRLDVHAWKERYPRLSVICPPQSRLRVSRVVAVDGGWELLPRDPALEAIPIAAVRSGEAALVVRSAGGARASLLFGDTFMNIPHQRGLGGLVLRTFGSSGGPKVTAMAQFFTIRNRGATAGALLELAMTPGLVRLVPSHGNIVDHEPKDVLDAVAHRLAGL